MTRSSRYAIALAALAALGLFAYAVHASDLTRLFAPLSALLYLPAMFIALMPIFRAENERRRIGWRAFVPIAVVLALPFLAFPAAGLVRDALDRWRFPKFEGLVRRIESNTIAVSTNFIRIPPEQAQAPLCDSVWAQRISNALVVEFITDVRGFPAYNAGFIYCSADRIPKDSTLTSRHAHRIRPHWFYFAQ